MIIEAEFEEVDGGNAGANEGGDQAARGELNLGEEDSLPWLEADETDDRGSSVDTAQLIGFLALLVAVLLVVAGLFWFVSNRDNGSEMVADGSTIEAPEGPYKERPDDAGGTEFPGTGDVAPGVGEGVAPEGQLANSTGPGSGAGSGDQDMGVAMPPIAGGSAPAGTKAGTKPSKTETTSTKATSASDAATTASTGATAGGVGVQLAAYTSEARAEQGWTELQRRSQSLSGISHRVVEGKIAMGTVYRLQAVMGNRAAADQLCRALKAEGLDCQVKR